MNISYLPSILPEEIILDTPGTTLFIGSTVSGDCTVKLSHPEAKAVVIILQHGAGAVTTDLTLTQKHLAPNSVSHIFVRALLTDQSAYHHRGMIHIENNAPGSVATLETRGLLLSPDARFQAIPSLEILPNDVTCHHKATAGPLDGAQKHYLETRGLTPKESEQLLTIGFMNGALDFLKLHCSDEKILLEFYNWLEQELKKYYV